MWTLATGDGSGIGALPAGGCQRDGRCRTCRRAGAAESALVDVEFGNRRLADPRPKPDGVRCADVGARLADDIAPGEAAVSDCDYGRTRLTEAPCQKTPSGVIAGCGHRLSLYWGGPGGPNTSCHIQIRKP